MRLLFYSLLVSIILFSSTNLILSQNVQYSNDDLNRLTEADYGNGTKITYTYDKLGNRTTTITTAPIIPCQTPSSISVTNVAETTVTLQWASVNGASSYTVQYCVNGTNSCNTVSTSNISYNLNGLSDGTSYDWRVKAVGCDADSPWTLYNTFTTIKTGPNCPTNIVISSAEIPYDLEYQTSNTISTSGNVTIASNKDVTFKSNQINLIAGFDAVAGSFFLAEVAACMAAALKEEEEKLASARNRIDPEEDKRKSICGHQMRIFPNPIGQNATIEYNLQEDTDLQLAIYTMDGRLVGKPLISKSSQAQGIHNLNLNADHLRKGEYICRMITSNNCIVVQKIVVQ